MLRRLSLVLVLSGATVCLAATAQAAPRKPVFKAPPPVPAASAPAFYAGVHGGWGWSRFSSPSTAETLSPNGPLGGFQVGVNYQLDKMVLGVEGDFSLASVRASTTGDLSGTTVTGGARHLWFGTLAGRLGYAFGRTLPYLKGGAAWTQYKWDFDAVAVGSATSKETRAGWMLGAGIEQAVTDAMSVKLEYNYMDFGTKSETMTTTGGIVSAPIDVKLYTHLLKLGVNYRFSGL